MNNFVHKLVDNKLDIIGDIHGEYDALVSLIRVLGYDLSGNHPDNRKLIFVGDLVDRGPSSVKVVHLVKQLMDNGNAQCIIGNHEMNIMMGLKREGNGWFFGSPHDDDKKAFNSEFASESDRTLFLEFFNSLPLVLESNKLRIVHACWDQESIDTLKSNNDTFKTAYKKYKKEIISYINKTGLNDLYNEEQKKYGQLLKDENIVPPYLPYTSQHDLLFQMNNPIRVIASGREVLVTEPYYTGGKWRMIDRVKWWESYEDNIPVIMGHYWRNMNKTSSTFDNIHPLAWFGKNNNVFCIDYSVGRRYVDRMKNNSFSNKLTALRFPENILVDEVGQTFNTIQKELDHVL